MIFSDFLSRFKHDTSDPHQIIPLSSSIQEVLHDWLSNIHESE